jgi:hypothetical protein
MHGPLQTAQAPTPASLRSSHQSVKRPRAAAQRAPTYVDSDVEDSGDEVYDGGKEGGGQVGWGVTV